MTRENIYTGGSANDGTGDTLRAAATKINNNFIEIYNAFDKLLKDGKDGVQFEIIAMRGENRIPLLYESAGIKKLISICRRIGSTKRSTIRRTGKNNIITI